VVSIGEQLVGRAEACGVFDDALSGLDRGRSAALVLVAEPGIGKTRLLVELAARADARGQLVLYGSASELERRTSWTPRPAKRHPASTWTTAMRLRSTSTGS
jgi:predicted ATP-dependent serine protease